MVVGETAVAMKQNDKIGLTCCDKSGGLVRRGRQVKCAAGGGGDGDCIGEDCIVYPEVVRRAKGVNDTAAGSIRFRGGMC